jgi:hypothetical protein
MTRSDGSLRQIGPLARLGLVEMPTRTKAVVALVGRLWYKSAVAQGLSGRNAPQNVRYGYGPRISRPSGAGVIGHHANPLEGEVIDE